MELHNDLVLHATPEHFIIEVNDENPPNALYINRQTRHIYIGTGKHPMPQNTTSLSICGIIGIINLVACPYLIVITKKRLLGIVAEQEIWCVVSTQMFPFLPEIRFLIESQSTCNSHYVSLVERFLKTPSFIFSYNYDLTHSLQRLHNISPDFLTHSLLNRADPRFAWNKILLEPISKCRGTDKFCLPITLGFASINDCVLNGNSYRWTLIARRSCERPGVRLFTRGVDQKGSVANFVEIEQIVEYNGEHASFIQTRGSIPLFWEQLPDLRLRPKPKLLTNKDHGAAFMAHFDTQILNYGAQVAVNLVNHHGPEGELEEAFSSYVKSCDIRELRYESFDFHKECAKMQWGKLHDLIKHLSPYMDVMGYCYLSRDGVALLQQDGIFRTNCVDCLDRTNVVQSMLACRNLEIVFHQMGILKPEENIGDHMTFQFLFKNRWADLGDHISIQYAGTGALKSDFTRLGRRTYIGMIKDGCNALQRYAFNNFCDGFRQDSFNLFLGHHKVKEMEGSSIKSPVYNYNQWYETFFPIMILIFFAIVAYFLGSCFNLPYSNLVSLVCVCCSIFYVYITNVNLIDNPRLCLTPKANTFHIGKDGNIHN